MLAAGIDIGRLEALEFMATVATKQDEPLEYLEARKMLYRLFSHLGTMPKVGPG